MFNYAIPAARFFPLIFFHSKPKETRKDMPPVAIDIMNTSRTALLYASRTTGSISEETMFRIPVAPAEIMSEGLMLGIFWEIRLTRVLDSTEFEMAKKIAPLSVKPYSKRRRGRGG